MPNNVTVVPRTKDITDVSWLLKTRRYIPHYDAYQAYKLIYGSEPMGQPSVDEWSKIIACDVDRDVRITANIVAHDFNVECVKEYLEYAPTKDIGIALAIEFRMLKDIVSIAEESDIILYLTEHILDDTESSLILESGLLKSIARRVIDKCQTMYTTLINNFATLLKLSDGSVISEKFIIGYLEHANFFNGDPLLRYIFEKFPTAHPLLRKLDCLAWDPFTKSRRFSHWLRVCQRMDELSKYYLELDFLSKNIRENKAYINSYLKFSKIYANDI